MWICALAVAAFADGLRPRSAASDYPHYASMPGAALGAEFHGRAFNSTEGSFLTRDYLVVETALFPSADPVRLAPSHFRLRINGKPPELLPVTPGTVALAILHPDDFEERPGLVASGGAGGGRVIFGQPRRTERFPGDPEARIPGAIPRTDQDSVAKSVMDAAELVKRFALDSVEAPRSGATGLIYFYWRGRISKLKKVELIYDGCGGRAVLRLR